MAEQEKEKVTGAEEKPDASKEAASKAAELDIDAELEAEEKRGKPDPSKAAERFRKSQENRGTEKSEEDGEKKPEKKDGEQKPVTHEDLERAKEDAESSAYKRFQTEQASAIAQRLGANEKEARLIFLKWQNRSFPSNMPLQDQMTEAYGMAFSKRIVSERNEALRALANKGKDAASESHRDGPTAGEPGLPENEKAAMKAAGFSWDGTKRLYVKSLGRRGFVFNDPKTKKTWNAAA